MIKNYREMILPVSGFDTDILAAVLHDQGILGILEGEKQWTVYLPDTWSAEEIDTLLKKLAVINAGFDDSDAKVQLQPVEDWNAEWRKHFEPFQPVEGLWIYPPWIEVPEKHQRKSLIIDPQMAFGTGHHETTRLMLDYCLDVDFAEKSVLDLGTGSGILAMVAQRRGGKTVCGVDYDPVAIDNAIHNARLNHLTTITYAVGTLESVTEKFDIVLANINLNVLNAIAGQLYHCLHPGGTLLLSGLLDSDQEMIQQCYTASGFTVVSRRQENEWIAILMQRQ